MSPSLRKTPNAQRLLLRMSDSVRVVFSPSQIQAMEEALVPRTHAVDVRLLLPLMGRGAYLVLAAGPNRRTPKRTEQLRSQAPSSVPHVLADVIAMSQSFQGSPNAYRMLQRMPRAVSTTFSAVQIQAIENALIPRGHVIDLRLSLPFLGKGAYFVMAAGPNKRSHYRNLQNGNPFVMPAVFTSVMIGAASIVGLVALKGSELLKQPDPVFAQGEEFHPTVVPFKKNRQECEESGREWTKEQCIDSVHDPVF